MSGLPWAGSVQRGGFLFKEFWTRIVFWPDTCLMCRGLVLCAGVLSYVQGSKSYVQGSKSYVQGSKSDVQGSKSYVQGSQSYVQGSKSYVQRQTLVTLFFYGVNALWRERSMA